MPLAPSGRKRLHAAILAIAGLAAITLTAPAQAWTDKPVRMIVPAPPGGTMDIVARILAEQLALDIGQPVVVDNKPGAGGAIAVQTLLAAPHDGQTIMMTASNVLTEIPHVMKSSFDPLKDLTPVASVTRASMVLIGNKDIPAQDLKGLIAWARANPGKLSFASYSAGTSSHYAGMILNQKAGLDLQHVPFQGSPPALTQVIGGQVAIMFDGMATSLPQLKAGKIKIFGVAGSQRSGQLPKVPTLAEQGYPDLNFSNWVGIVASSKMAPELINKINAAALKAADTPRVKFRLVNAGFELNSNMSSAQLAKSVQGDFERNAKIVNAFGIRLNQ